MVPGTAMFNPRRAWFVCMSVRTCLCVRHHESYHYAQLTVQSKVPTASAQSGKHFKYGVFSFVQKLWLEKANKLISNLLTATTFRQKF